VCADGNENKDAKDNEGEGLNVVCADVNANKDGKDNEGRTGGGCVGEERLRVEMGNSTPPKQKVSQRTNNKNAEGEEKRRKYEESMRKLNLFVGIGNEGGEVSLTNGII
jgi:hypothetical protein